MKRILFLALTIIICLQVTNSFAEYGILPLDNQIEQQIFNDNNTLGMIYSSVEIRGTTLILKLTPNGKYRHEESLADLRRIMKIRVNQFYESAGSNKRISKIVYSYEGKILTDEWSEKLLKAKEKEGQSAIGRLKRIHAKALQEEACTFKIVKEVPEYEYADVRMFYDKTDKLVAKEIYKEYEGYDMPYIITSEGNIPDGNADLWINSWSISGAENTPELWISTPYKNNKRDVIEKHYTNA